MKEKFNGLMKIPSFERAFWQIRDTGGMRQILSDAGLSVSDEAAAKLTDLVHAYQHEEQAEQQLGRLSHPGAQPVVQPRDNYASPQDYEDAWEAYHQTHKLFDGPNEQ